MPLLHAKDAQEAVAYLDLLKSKVELAVIDLALGWELIGRLMQHDRKAVKIIVTTSIYSVDVLKKIKERGVDVVVRKPVTRHELHTTLETVMA